MHHVAIQGFTCMYILQYYCSFSPSCIAQQGTCTSAQFYPIDQPLALPSGACGAHQSCQCRSHHSHKSRCNQHCNLARQLVHIVARHARCLLQFVWDTTIHLAMHTQYKQNTGLEQQEYEFALNSLTRRRPTQLRLHSKTLESRDAVLKQAKLNVVDPKSREMYDQLQVVIGLPAGHVWVSLAVAQYVFHTCNIRFHLPMWRYC